MKERKVLIIAYYFPPLGMGGVQRITKFVKYLPLFGWKPYVLTVKDIEYMARDTSLLNEISDETRVIRTGSFDPLRISFLLRSLFGGTEDKAKAIRSYSAGGSRLTSWLFFPDNKVGWIPFALRKGLSLCRREKIDLIFSSSPPPSVHLSAYLIKRAAGIPWVADFRDPWIGYKQEIYPAPVHLFLKKSLERLIVKGADRVIAANPAIKGEFDKRHPGAAKVRLVDQGYDEEDFGAIRSSPPETFTIGYLGTFSPDCDPRPFLAALGELVEQKTIPPGKIRVVHVGLDLGLNLQGLIRKHKLEDVFERKGYLAHRESLQQMQETSLLLLTTSDQPLVFPAKVFEYLRLKKPILAIVPQESDMAKFIREMKVGKVVSPEDREGIKQALLSYFSDHQAKRLTLKVDEDRLRKYERKSLSEKLASIFEEIVSGPC